MGYYRLIINSTPPDYNVVTDGRLGLSVLNLPFNASYRYSTKGAISGINNHFTIDFDAQQFKQDQLNRIEEYKQKGKQAVEGLQNKLQDLEKKLDYMQLANSGQISSKGIDIPHGRVVVTWRF